MQHLLFGKEKEKQNVVHVLTPKVVDVIDQLYSLGLLLMV